MTKMYFDPPSPWNPKKMNPLREIETNFGFRHEVQQKQRVNKTVNKKILGQIDLDVSLTIYMKKKWSKETNVIRSRANCCRCSFQTRHRKTLKGKILIFYFFSWKFAPFGSGWVFVKGTKLARCKSSIFQENNITVSSNYPNQREIRGRWNNYNCKQPQTAAAQLIIKEFYVYERPEIHLSIKSENWTREKFNGRKRTWDRRREDKETKFFRRKKSTCLLQIIYVHIYLYI